MAIIFKPNHRRVVDALTDIIQTEYQGTPVLFEEPSKFLHRSPQFFSIIPGDATLLQNYSGGSLREYQVAIRYYLRKPRLINYRTSIFDYMTDRGERLTRLINNNTKYEDIYFFINRSLLIWVLYGWNSAPLKLHGLDLFLKFAVLQLEGSQTPCILLSNIHYKQHCNHHTE